MKNNRWRTATLLWVCLLALAGCGGGRGDGSATTDSAGADTAGLATGGDIHGDTAVARPGTGDAGSTGHVPYDNLIMPGKSVGRITLGDSLQVANRKLGPPDSSEGAAGHIWSYWRSRGGDTLRHQLGIYASLNDSATHHVIRQIVITSPSFRTESGISTASTLPDILRAFAGAHMVAAGHSRGSGGPSRLYDDTAAGIAFEVAPIGTADSTAGRCLAIIVHQPGKKANAF